MPRALLASLFLVLATSWTIGPLDLVQGFAWMQMISQRQAEAGLAEAVQSTFDPAKPCALCCEVRLARSLDQMPDQQAPPPAEHTTHVLLSRWQEDRPQFAAPGDLARGQTERPHDQSAWSSRRDTPDPPPPRVLV